MGLYIESQNDEIIKIDLLNLILNKEKREIKIPIRYY